LLVGLLIRDLGSRDPQSCSYFHLWGMPVHNTVLQCGTSDLKFSGPKTAQCVILRKHVPFGGVNDVPINFDSQLNHKNEMLAHN